MAFAVGFTEIVEVVSPFVQRYVPPGILTVGVSVVEDPLHNAVLAGNDTVGTGLTVIVAVSAKLGQPLSV